MQNSKLLIATIVITIALVFGIGWAMSKLFANSSAPVTPNMTVEQSRLLDGATHFRGAPVNQTISAEDQNTEGDTANNELAGTGTKYNIVEFADFQCPACKDAEPTLQALVQQYPNDVSLTYRYFPLRNIHPSAQIAAQAAEAASKQNKFWEMHDKLFATQDSWTAVSPDKNKQTFIDYAAELGLNRDQFAADIDSQDVVNKVNADNDLALNDLQLQYTPSIFLNGKLLDISEVVQQINAGETAAATQSASASATPVSVEKSVVPTQAK